MWAACGGCGKAVEVSHAEGSQGTSPCTVCHVRRCVRSATTACGVSAVWCPALGFGRGAEPRHRSPCRPRACQQGRESTRERPGLEVVTEACWNARPVPSGGCVGWLCGVRQVGGWVVWSTWFSRSIVTTGGPPDWRGTKSSTVEAALLCSRRRKNSGPMPAAVPTSAWFTALWATTRAQDWTSSSRRISCQAIDARCQSSTTGCRPSISKSAGFCCQVLNSEPY